ncbi:MAG: site-specific DNA-methyltransferase [Parabacteroides sp.]
MDTQALKEKIRQLEGLTDEERTDLLALLNQKKYGLVWEEKPEEVEERLRTQLPVLEEVKERALLSDDLAAPNHILIEGDNLEALVALTYTHEGKVDVIYIDPPYNTGNKDFSYNDSYVDAEDGYRHSKWLSFMSKRLKIAKQLLSENGTIFISIDENEVANLRILCDEIFSEKNFVGQWNWFKSATPPALSYKVKRNVEYILAYEKKRSAIKYKGIQKVSASDDPMTKPQNSFKILTFPAGTLHCKSNDYIVRSGVYGTTKYPNELLNDLIIENGKNTNEVSFRNRFIWLQNTLNEQIKKGTIFNLSKSLVISYKRKEYDPEVPPNFIDDSVAVSTTEEAGKNLIDILGCKGFDYPKPVSLIKYLLGFRDASIILDFFAGSGTTLHATMQLNQEDGGHRQCILVTNNENKICEEVTYVRNKRVIQGYVTPKGDYVEGLKANTLRYYRTKLLPRVETNQHRRALIEACTELLCIQQDLYAEQPCFAGRKLNPRKARYFVQGKRRMLVIYDEQTVDTFAELLREMEVEEKIRIYLFSFNGYPYTDNFMEVLDKVELCALPQAIYNVYKRVLPKEADPANEEEEMA